MYIYIRKMMLSDLVNKSLINKETEQQFWFLMLACWLHWESKRAIVCKYSTVLMKKGIFSGDGISVFLMMDHNDSMISILNNFGVD